MNQRLPHPLGAPAHPVTRPVTGPVTTRVSRPAKRPGDPLGLHRVLDDRPVLPQAAARLDTRPDLWPDEVRVRVERLNLDAASLRQLAEHHGHDADAVRAALQLLRDNHGARALFDRRLTG